MALRLPGGNYSSEMKGKIEIYNQKDSTNVQDDLEDREDLKSKMYIVELSRLDNHTRFPINFRVKWLAPQ